ncbi:MAG: hypothetical protein H7256_09480 [Bdellovibrio sp.]|nr:hypothetical protein [Bdellovibrio sp.]
MNQQVALETLRNMGYEPQAVVSGPEVLQALKETPFDLILMDCQMP